MNIKGKTFLYTCLCTALLAGCSAKNGTTGPNDDDSQDSSSSYSKSGDKDDSSSSGKSNNSSSSATSGSSESSNSSSSTNNESNSSSSGTEPQKSTQDVFLNPDIEYGELKDMRDGSVYKTVKIGIQTWMAQNLDLKTDNSEESRYNCGKLYPWGDAVDLSRPHNNYCHSTDKFNYQGICPDGWHLPQVHDWNILVNYVKKQGYTNIGAALKSKRNNAWPEDSTATDAFGFSAVYGGYISYAGVYVGYGSVGHTESGYWLAEEDGPRFSDTYAQQITFSAGGAGLGGSFKDEKDYVRCVKNYDIDEGAKPAPKAGSVYDSVANTLTDLRDNKVYKTTQIVDQVWMAENLTYVTDGGYADKGVGSKCNTVKDSIYTCFYRWNAALDVPSGNMMEAVEVPEKPQGLCPSGWHIPNKQEFQHLYENVGKKVADLSSTEGWREINNFNPATGFNLQPLGYYIACGYETYSYAGLWTADNDSSTGSAYMFSNGTSMSLSEIAKRKYLSVRCIRDEGATPIEFTDFGSYTDTRDNKVYRTTKIGDDTWMADNMNYVDNTSLLKTGSLCYDSTDTNCTTYGRLYTWNAATLNGTEQGICPEGWHISTRTDWDNLEKAVNNTSKIGALLKATRLWKDIAYPKNEYGFTAIPAGYYDGSFKGLGTSAQFWTSTIVSDSSAFYYSISSGNTVLEKFAKSKSVARSVRCVKNKE